MTVLSPVFLIMLLLSVAYGCSCPTKHLQQYFCQSKFVIHAVPIAESKPMPIHFGGRYYYQGHSPQTMYRTYTMIIIEVFKDTSRRVRPLTIRQVLTVDSAAACGVKLELFKQYIIGGYLNNKRKMMLNSCYLNRLYSSITSCELSLMRGSKSYMYRRRKRPPHRYPYKRIIGHYHIPYAPKKGAAGYDCSCMVRSCPVGTLCPPNANSCTWAWQSNPQMMYCERGNSYKGYRGHCHWHACPTTTPHHHPYYKHIG